tara:strand:+ start:1341 stop:2354 length:1014 start_codon:yes stop_codon:yes gene_type:complete
MENFNNNYLIVFIFSIFNLITYLFINKYKQKFLFFLVDNPDGKRKLHSEPVLIIGGIFIAIYFILISIFAFWSAQNSLLLILIISIIIFFIGLLDDYFSLSAYNKLFFISIVILIGLYMDSELKINVLYLSTFNKLLTLNFYSYIFTTLCILLLINCLNLSDGINGLATGIGIIWLLNNLIYSDSKISLILIPLIFLLILIFFAIYKTKFFLGDNGSLIISSFVGFITILNYNQNLETSNSVISAENIFIFFMLPGLDMFRLFIERLLKSKDPFSGDRNHLHHLLIKKFSLKKTLSIYFGLMIFFIVIDQLKLIPSIYIIISFVILYFFLIKKLKNY